jgi:polyribonucleotide nucleotidyltransferase
VIEAIDFGYEGGARPDQSPARALIKELGIEIVTEAEPETDPTLATFIEEN